MEELLSSCLAKRSSFELFKSSVCHRLKEMGDPDFIMDVLKSREIRTYYDRGWYPESLYLLAMLDYVSRLNGVPLCSEYDDLRICRLEKPLYPAGVLAISAASKNDSARATHPNTAATARNAIPYRRPAFSPASFRIPPNRVIELGMQVAL